MSRLNLKRFVSMLLVLVMSFTMIPTGAFADELIDGYEIENTIIVGVPYKNYEDRKRKYIPAGDQFEASMRFLAHELVPYLDDEFSTTQVGGGRALIGDSMAATISLMTAIHYPNIFGKAVLQSPYVDELVLQAVKDAKNFSFVFNFSAYSVLIVRCCSCGWGGAGGKFCGRGGDSFYRGWVLWWRR